MKRCIMEKIDIDYMFELHGKDYIVLAKTIYNNTTYFFCNEVVNDEPTSKYKIYKEIGEEFIEETNRTILEEIIEDLNEQIEVRIRDFRNSIGME